MRRASRLWRGALCTLGSCLDLRAIIDVRDAVQNGIKPFRELSSLLHMRLRIGARLHAFKIFFGTPLRVIDHSGLVEADMQVGGNEASWWRITSSVALVNSSTSSSAFSGLT